MGTGGTGGTVIRLFGDEYSEELRLFRVIYEMLRDYYDMPFPEWLTEWLHTAQPAAPLPPPRAYPEEREEIRAVLKEAAAPMTITEVATALGEPYANVRKLLWKMARAEEIVKLGDGRYSASSAPLLIATE